MPWPGHVMANHVTVTGATCTVTPFTVAPGGLCHRHGHDKCHWVQDVCLSPTRRLANAKLFTISPSHGDIQINLKSINFEVHNSVTVTNWRGQHWHHDHNH